ncbi:hypothetical protein [Lentzea jiangxiensis]|uniref:hypothetical protein n=1 Tax=Lentzea jiangxiensis TaxID=641025 RepID=UPI001160021F|nr:hypothetical protein [Lentzea jiangxiensis]
MQSHGWQPSVLVERALLWPPKALDLVTDVAAREETTFTALAVDAVRHTDWLKLNKIKAFDRAQAFFRNNSKILVKRTLYWEEEWDDRLDEILKAEEVNRQEDVDPNIALFACFYDYSVIRKYYNKEYRPLQRGRLQKTQQDASEDFMVTATVRPARPSGRIEVRRGTPR